MVLGLLLLSTVLWPSEERVGRLEEPEGRACFPPPPGLGRPAGGEAWALESLSHASEPPLPSSN